MLQVNFFTYKNLLWLNFTLCSTLLDVAFMYARTVSDNRGAPCRCCCRCTVSASASVHCAFCLNRIHWGSSPDKHVSCVVMWEQPGTLFLNFKKNTHIYSFIESLLGCQHCKIRNISEEVSEKSCSFCTYGLELISIGLNTSYCQTAWLLWLFNTTSKRVANKPTRYNLGTSWCETSGLYPIP